MNPLATIYGGVVGARNSLYDRGVLRTRRLIGPVVSIGNLSTGGSGKTPFVLMLGELLKARGIKFDVLSRGYGRAGGSGDVPRKLRVGQCGRAQCAGDVPSECIIHRSR